MNVKITKRILSGALAVALVMAPSVGAFASTNSAATAPTTKVETSAPEVVVIKNLMKNQKITFDEAVKMAGISKSKQKKLQTLI